MPGLLAIAAATVLLGSPGYAPMGNGFGTEHPAAIFNGGAPSGGVNDITWSGWGAPVAAGRGLSPIYLPQGGYFAREARIALRAEKIGTCPDGTAPAYTVLRFRAPNWPGGPLGPWVKWGGSKGICSFDEPETGTPAGICATVGSRNYTPGTMFNITAYRVSCRTARRAASTLRHMRCRRGCTRSVRRLHCRLQRLHGGELAPNLDHRYPAQRVACTRRSANFSGWLALPRH
jgi:hypothetical protein